MSGPQPREDVRIESYSPEMLNKYGITYDSVLQCVVDAFIDGRLGNWFLPLAKDKKKFGKDSALGLLVQGEQKSYNDQSINPSTIEQHPNARSFICLFNPNYNTTNDNNNDKNNNNNNTNMNNNESESKQNSHVSVPMNNISNMNISDFECGGTITVCPPDATSDTGFHNLFQDEYIMPSLKHGLKHEPIGYCKFLKTSIWMVLNREPMFNKIQNRLKSYWYIETVCVNPKYQGNGIGSYMLNYVLYNYIKMKSIENNYNDGFVLLGTGNPKAKNYYIKNGFECITQWPLPTKRNDLGDVLDGVRYMWMLWHWDKEKLKNMVDMLNNQDGIDKVYQTKSLCKLMTKCWLCCLVFVLVTVITVVLLVLLV